MRSLNPNAEIVDSECINMLETKRRSVLELDFETNKEYANPFIDVELDCKFASPSGKEHVVPGFYDGEHRWEVRFSPNETGGWSYETSTNVADRSLESADRFEVTEPDELVRGFLKTCPSKYWGLE